MQNHDRTSQPGWLNGLNVRLRRSHDRTSDDDKQEDDEHFDGRATNPDREPGIAEPEDTPPPYTEEELV